MAVSILDQVGTEAAVFVSNDHAKSFCFAFQGG
jgi:hypothetical protein